MGKRAVFSLYNGGGDSSPSSEQSIDDRYVTKEELSQLLSISVRTIEKHSRKIPGRVKMGRSIRYYLPDIHRCLLSGRNLFSKK